MHFNQRHTLAPITTQQQSFWFRYVQLTIIILGSGAVFPLVYLRQNFEVTLVQALGISSSQLGECYSLLGIMFVITYLPSGWLADRISPRYLITGSLLGTALLGIWFSTYPNFQSVKLIFLGWGITTGLALWAALIKSVNVLAGADFQGRFFGLLDGGRGLVEAILATIAVGLFAYFLNEQETNLSSSLQNVIYMYIGFMLLMVPLVFFTLQDSDNTQSNETHNTKYPSNFLAIIKLLITNKRLWLAMLCLLFGYQLFWATYSFSAYLQGSLALPAVTVGIITVAKLWMRPLGAMTIGFVGDRFQIEWVLMWLMLLGGLSLFSILLLDTGSVAWVIIGLVMTIGLLTYAIRGLYWSTLEACNIPVSIKGMAVGFMSLVGYAPDIYLPMLSGYLLDNYAEKRAYMIYFSMIAGGGFVGAWAAWLLYREVRNESI